MQYLKFYGGNMEENEIIEVSEDITEVVEEESEEVIEEVETEEIEIEDRENDNEILIEYIKQQLNTQLNEVESENVQIDDSNNGDDPVLSSDIQSVDPQLLEDIFNELEIQTGYIEEYNRNNTMQSEVEDISLTNTLLIIVFIGILFTAVLNFSRRIF